MKKALTILTALFSSTLAMAQTTPEQNKANVLAFYDLALVQGKPQAAVDKYLGKEYLQHNPNVADGGEAFVKAFSNILEKNPHQQREIKRVIAEKDLVVLHVHTKKSPDNLGNAVVDIFRLDENGKIVEHWDVSQPVPEKTVSGRGMF